MMLPPPASTDEGLRTWQQNATQLLNQLAAGQAQMQSAIEVLATKFVSHVESEEKEEQQRAQAPQRFQSWSNWAFGCASVVVAGVVMFASVVSAAASLYSAFHH